MSHPDPYLVGLPSGDIIETENGIPPKYRKAGVIVRPLRPASKYWYHWNSATDEWQPILAETVPAHLKTYALLRNIPLN